tara:strand:- start:3361 stop:3546 length:186 start_codon:yes stop_codon:yes gene_type:complete
METLTNKPSCILELKQLVDELTDRDVRIKTHLKSIKTVLADESIKTDSIKIKKIKQILKDG